MTLDHGRRLGPYEIQSRVGAGGMGEVYNPEAPILHRHQYAVSPDGNSFVMHTVVGEASSPPVTVILNRQPGTRR